MVYGTSYAVMERASIDMDEKEDSNASNKRRHYLKVIDIKAMSLKKKNCIYSQIDSKTQNIRNQ